MVNYETIINLIGDTKTRTGLKVKAVLDTNEYETGLKVSEEQLAGIRLRRHSHPVQIVGQVIPELAGHGVRVHNRLPSFTRPGTTRSHLAIVSNPSVHNVHIIS